MCVRESSVRPQPAGLLARRQLRDSQRPRAIGVFCSVLSVVPCDYILATLTSDSPSGRSDAHVLYRHNRRSAASVHCRSSARTLASVDAGPWHPSPRRECVLVRRSIMFTQSMYTVECDWADDTVRPIALEIRSWKSRHWTFAQFP